MTAQAPRHAFQPDASGERTNDMPPVGSSFYLGLRLLPRPQRVAMYAIYAFCRAVDDVADGEDLRETRLARLARWRSGVADLYSGATPLASMRTLHDAVLRFALARADFEAIIEGMAMDVRGESTMPDWATLDRYCDRVASAPGRLSVRVFGLSEEPGRKLAHHLGRALQLTNILRDVDEDAELGRLYLPREALAEAGVIPSTIAGVLADPRLSPACRIVAETARRHFIEADRIMNASPRYCVRAPRLMAAAYRPLLEGLLVRGWSPPRHKVAKRKLAVAGAVLRYGLF